MVKITLALLIYYTTCTWFMDPAFNSRCQTSVCGKKKDRERGRKGVKEGGREQRKKKKEGYFLGILGNQEKEIFSPKLLKILPSDNSNCYLTLFGIISPYGITQMISKK